MPKTKLFRQITVCLAMVISMTLSFFVSADTNAKKSNNAKKQKEYWVKLSIKRAHVWPVKKDGRCWDPCMGKRYLMPVRQLEPFDFYLKNKNFRNLNKGWKAPDLRVQIQIDGRKWSTKTNSDSPKANWNFRKLVRIRPNSKLVITVFDNDLWSHDVIGRFTTSNVPQKLLTGGTLLLRKIGQVELLELKSERLQPVQKTSSLPQKEAPLLPQKAKLRLENNDPVHKQSRIPSETKTIPYEEKEIVLKTQKARNLEKQIIALKKKTVSNAIKSKKPDVQIFRLTIKQANLWPIKKTKRCWDLCVFKRTKLPPRGMPNYKSYYTNGTFRKMATGYGAPDPWVQIKSKSKVWKTKILKNILQPKWNASFLIRLKKGDPISLTVYDQDLYFKEKMGQVNLKSLPGNWWDGGKWTLRSFGQVESLEIELKPLNTTKKKTVVQYVEANELPESTMQFVRVTVVKAKLWPLTKHKGCWDPCTSGYRKPFPTRGLSNYKYYLKDSNFQEMTQGTRSPDPRVRVQIGNYDLYVTPTIQNSTEPTWNASHLFRLRGNEPITISVTDDDETIAHDLLRTYRTTRELMGRWSADTIGTIKLPHLPKQALKGGTVVLRSFGQVEMLELKFEPVQRTVTEEGCEGVYRVRIAELEVEKTRFDGKPWHAGIGRLGNPSPFIKLNFGGYLLETPVAYKQLKIVYQSSRLIPIRKTTPLSLIVKDFSVGVRFSLDKQYKIPFLPIRVGLGMKREPSAQEIGQNAFLTLCPLLKKAKNGKVRIPPFGRVKSLLLFFDKIS